MQIIVLGMHRSGTSVVARLLNMMGAYFAPDETVMQFNEDNPKGYWEREDVRILNDDIFRTLGVSWDNISDFDSALLTAEIFKEFSPRIKQIVFNLDAHRPWMIKDPRLCLLLSVWRPLLEVPICVCVYRNPIQIAQSLRKREVKLSINEGATLHSTHLAEYSKEAVNFPINLGIALWEKYMLSTLANSQGIPRILISFHDLIDNPIKTIENLYQDLTKYEIQGLRLPSNREIKAFIEPKLQHQKGNNNLQNIYINKQQSQLVAAFQSNSVFKLTPVPKLSTSAIEILAEYQNKLLAANKILIHQQEVANRDQQIANLNQEVANRDQQIVNLNQEVANREQQIANLNQEVANREQQIANLNQEVANREREIVNLNQEVANREQQIVNLNQEVIQISHHKKHIIELETHIETINLSLKNKSHEISEQAKQINNLNYQLELQEQKIHKLVYWLSALGEDINAVFTSLTWRLGQIFTRIVLAFMFRKVGLTAKDHIQQTLTAIEIWQQSISSDSNIPIQNIVTATKYVPLITSLKKSISKIDNSKDYSVWIDKYDTLTPETIKKMQAQIENWTSPPLISIVMPTYNTDEKWLRAAINSVTQQIYPHWELCIADDASTQTNVRQILQEYAANDKRIKVTFRTENGHISAASNTALELATGEFIALLDHDDELAKHALFWVAKTIIENPEIMLLYSDEDKIDEKGKRCEPFFKPDWNPNLFLSYNFITHLIVYRSQLIKQITGFREGYEGSQDYDLALRAIEQIEPNQIYHIPRILYHWRKIPGSTATQEYEKPYAIIAAQKAVSEYLIRQNIDAQVTESPLLSGTIRVQYQLPSHPPLITIIIPTYNGYDLLRQCVESILNKTNYPNFEILIVNNNSDEAVTLNYLQQLQNNEKIHILDYPHTFNYSAINNTAVQEASGELICLLNNDIEVINPSWLTEMVSHALRPEIGAVGARLWYPDNRLQHGGVIVGLGGIAGHSHKYLERHCKGYFGRIAVIQDLSAVTAACMVLRKETYLNLGGLDAENLKIAFNDVDFCLRIKETGLQILWTPYAELYHHESASRGEETTPAKKARFEQECLYMKKRWGNNLLQDPAYSPNLTLNIEDFSYAWPPRVADC